MELQISGFGVVLLFLVGSVLFIVVTLFVGRILRPNAPNEEKNATYESGEQTVGDAWGIFNIRFYVIAIIFLLFEIELVFLFPWATIFGNKALIEETGGLWGWFSLTETIIFVGLLAVGLVYVWANGMLDWEKPSSKTRELDMKVPESFYEEINKKYS
jgi:NADH-quinone oxidoreductase subunit A